MAKIDKTQKALLRLLTGTLVDDYKLVEVAPNIFGQQVVNVVNEDGSQCDPPIFIAVRS